MTFVYVGNTESNEIHVLRLDRQSGDLTLVEKVPIPGVTKPGNSTPMAVSPDRKFVYAGTRGEPKIAAAFAIDPTSGKLKHVASGPLADSMAYIAVDRTGCYLLGASYPGHKVTVSRIDPPGTVQSPHQVIEGHQPRAFAIDSSGRYLLAVGQLSHAMSSYRIDPESAKLTKLKEYPMGKNPNWIEIVDLP